MDRIFDNNRKWAAAKRADNPEYFVNLAKGQQPEILYIGCSDSRVTAEELMGLGPGEVFVHRNIANTVPNMDVNALSVIEYAVAHLKVKHVVVCGHQGCGGVKAAMSDQGLGILDPWLRNIRDVYRLHREELDGMNDENERYRRLVELNVQEQCINVLKVESVQRARRERGMQISGLVFDIATGELQDLQIDFDRVMDARMQRIYG